jgi:hypothetical protein
VCVIRMSTDELGSDGEDEPQFEPIDVQSPSGARALSPARRHLCPDGCWPHHFSVRTLRRMQGASDPPSSRQVVDKPWSLRCLLLRRATAQVRPWQSRPDLAHYVDVMSSHPAPCDA